MKQLPRALVLTSLVVTLALGAASTPAAARIIGQASGFVSVGPLAADPILPDTPGWVRYGSHTDSVLGTFISTCDINGDGYSDVLITTNTYRGPGGMHAGRVDLFLGSSSGLGTTPAWWVQGGPECGNYYCNVGAGMASAGDVNGDGYDDVIVGVNRWSNGQYDEGRVFLYHGSAAGLSTTPAWMAESNRVQGYFGYAVSTAGDVNGDGYDDIVVGGGASYGVGLNKAFVYLGSPTGLSCGGGCPVDAAAAAAWSFTLPQATANVGGAVSTAGDLNGDGFSDVLVAAPLYDDVGKTDAGMVWAFLGSSSGLSSAPIWSAVGDQAGAQFGFGLGAAGDVNGDGYADFVVGAPRYDNGQTDEGRVYLFLGSATGPGASPAWISEPDQATTAYGTVARTVGDLNGDGFADIVITGPEWDGAGLTNQGKAWVYLGSAAGLSGTAAWSMVGGQAGAQFGYAANAGDVNGDGRSDLLIGAHLYDYTYVDNGAVFLYYGLNRPPVAAVGGPYTVAEGSSVTLDGTGSYDPDPGDTLTYAWDLDNDGVYETPGAIVNFTGLDGPASHPVALRVCDPQAACAADATTVAVNNVAPTAQAGAGLTVYRNEPVSLAGTWTDPAATLDEPYAWAWDLDGDGVPDVNGSAAYGETGPATVTFAAEGIYEPAFTVADADGENGQDTVRITVLNRAPVCSAAAASPALLWPPNNKFVPVSIGGVTDPEGDPLSLTITGIYQDEPVGKGNSAPDGKGVGTATAELRAEKLGSGDGRVYHVYFTVGDGHGGTCTGEVLVTVPHDQAKPAVDGGPLYDSTVPSP